MPKTFSVRIRDPNSVHKFLAIFVTRVIMPCQYGAKHGVKILAWKKEGIGGAIALTTIVGIVVVDGWFIAPETPISFFIIGQVVEISEEDWFPVAALQDRWSHVPSNHSPLAKGPDSVWSLWSHIWIHIWFTSC